MLDGRIARLTNTTSAFGVEFDSLADVISFGAAPAVLAFAWGLTELGQLGWAAGFIFLSAAAMRLARFNIQTSVAGRQALLRRHADAGRRPASSPPRSTRWPDPLPGPSHRRSPRSPCARAGGADGQHDPVPQLQDDQLRLGPSYLPLLAFILLVAFIATEPRITLLILAYSYLLSAFVETGDHAVAGAAGGAPPAASP